MKYNNISILCTLLELLGGRGTININKLIQ